MIQTVQERLDELASAKPHSDALLQEHLGHDSNPKTFPDSVYNGLPLLLEKTVKHFKDNAPKRDYLLLGALATTGAVMRPVYGEYAGKKCHPNLYFFLSGHAGTGKGSLTFCYDLVKPIHNERVRKSKDEYAVYQQELSVWQADKNKDQPKPEPPDQKLLKIPADQTKAVLIKSLSENEGSGLIFETEADALSASLKNDNGQHSELFRKAFHHETIDVLRKTDREYYQVNNPRISVVMSGTPDQAKRLIPTTENGLLSRFMFYNMPTDVSYMDPYASNNQSLDSYFESLGNAYQRFHSRLDQCESIKFTLTAGQQKRSTEYFQEVFEGYKQLYGDGFSGTVIRMGITLFRLAMTFTVLRLDDGKDKEIPSEIQCSDDDFDRSLLMCQVLIHHASSVLTLIDKSKNSSKNITIFYENIKILGKEFLTSQAVEIGRKLGISERSVKRHLSLFCAEYKIWKIKKEAHGKYTILL